MLSHREGESDKFWYGEVIYILFYFFLFPARVDDVFSVGDFSLSDWEVGIGAEAVVEDVGIGVAGSVSNLYLKCIEGDVEEDPVERKLKEICDRKNVNAHQESLLWRWKEVPFRES
jgi:hypothetical protein